jgi:hypothetical protein
LEVQERKIDGLDFFKIHFHFCVCVFKCNNWLISTNKDKYNP